MTYNDLYIYIYLICAQKHPTPCNTLVWSCHFEQFWTCVPWLVARSINIQVSKRTQRCLDGPHLFHLVVSGDVPSILALLEQLPWIWAHRSVGGSNSRMLSELSDCGMERSDGGFILSKVCAEQVGWTLDSISFFLFLSLYCLFVANVTRQQTHANQDKPRLWTITEQTQGASRMVAQHKPYRFTVEKPLGLIAMAGCKWAPEGGEIGLLSLGSPVMTLVSDIERPELTDVDCFREKLLALDQVGFDSVELSY